MKLSSYQHGNRGVYYETHNHEVVVDEELPLIESQSVRECNDEEAANVDGNGTHAVHLSLPRQPSNSHRRRLRRRRRSLRVNSPASLYLLVLVGMALCVSYTNTKNSEDAKTTWGDNNSGLLSRLLGHNQSKQQTKKRQRGGSSKSGLLDRILDDNSYVDIPDVSCDVIYNNEFFDFHNYLNFLHTMSVENALQIDTDGHIYKMEYGGMSVTVHVDNDDEDRIINSVLVDGFDFFDTYHEQIQFVNLPLDTVGESLSSIARKVPTATFDDSANSSRSDDDNDPEKVGIGGCRVFHTFVAIFSENAPVTLEEWKAASDQEMIKIHRLFSENSLNPK